MKSKNNCLLIILTLLIGLLLTAGCSNELSNEDMNGQIPGEGGDMPGESQDNGVLDDNSDNGVVAEGCWEYQPSDMAPKPGWDNVNLDGLTREELVDVLGCPPHVIRMTSVVSVDNNRELWVYHPYAEDPTGLYVWLKGDIFHYSTLDEFNGFGCYRMTDLEFWE